MRIHTNRLGRTTLARSVWLVATLLITGCTPAQDLTQPPPRMPTCQEIATKYNNNLARLDRLWARVVVELHWRDDKGKKHFEQGDGNLMILMPDRVALSIGKLGNTIMWAGSDGQRYWLFDLQDEPVLYVGQNTAADSANATRKLAIPIRPTELTRLLAITPLDKPSLSCTVAWDKGDFQINGLPSQMVWVEPKRYLPTRVDLLDQTGHASVTSRLSRWEPMTIQGLPPGAFPWIATRAEVELPGQDGTMTLFLSAPTDGRQSNRIKEKAFSLDHLIRVFKPTRVVDLDAQDSPAP